MAYENMTVSSITTDDGGAVTTVVVTGANFQAGTTAKVVKPDSSEVACANVVVVDGDTITMSTPTVMVHPDDPA
ncbi:uncharacterized protein METZ01_LOCUS377933, partial [marine metagenome]